MADRPSVQNVSAWFAGPKAENGEAFASTIHRILDDYHYWRKNYFPEDGVIVDSKLKREGEEFADKFEDTLLELLAALKADVPFYNPRYAAHMVAEQTLPSIAGYFAAMLYNPNNVSSEAAPVTVRLELEASKMIAKMLGYGDDCWAHLTSGGTVATLEALWIARTVKYLPLVIGEMSEALDLDLGEMSRSWTERIGMSPTQTLSLFAECFAEAERTVGLNAALAAYRQAGCNVVEQGIGQVCRRLGSDPVLIVPETHHYCMPKALDILGIGRQALLTVKVDRNFRMNVADLRDVLEYVDRSGKHVLAVVAVVGTTEEGAVDPVDQILELRSTREAEGKPSFWLHADAAYGGYLRTTTVPSRLGLGEAYSEVEIDGHRRRVPIELPVGGTCDALERLGECDSITVDPHKLGYIPYPAGVICYRSNLVKPIARQDAPYIEDATGGAEAERNSEAIGVYVLEGSKPGAAAAAVWLSHKLIPLNVTGHGKLIRETVRNACELHALLARCPSLQTDSTVVAVPLCAPGSNILCYAFRSTYRKLSLAEINQLNRAIYERFSNPSISDGRLHEQRFFISRTVLLPDHYSLDTVSDLLTRLGVTAEEYEKEGVFLLRSVLMNPWYGLAKEKGRYFVAELASDLYQEAEACLELLPKPIAKR